jgi:hypothetical protein
VDRNVRGKARYRSRQVIDSLDSIETAEIPYDDRRRCGTILRAWFTSNFLLTLPEAVQDKLGARCAVGYNCVEGPASEEHERVDGS